MQWVTESTESYGCGPFRSSETTTHVHTERTITHAVATIESAGPTQAVTDKTTGTLIQPGVQLNSQGLFEFIGAQALFPAVMNTMQHDVLSRTETSGFLSMGYSSEGGSSMFHARAQGGSFILPKGARFNGANVLMECPHIESPFFDLGGGRLRLALGRDHFQFQTWEKEEDLFWRSVSQRASYDLTYVMPTIVGELEVRNGHVDIEVVANRSKAFSEQIKLVHSTQELNWLVERHVYEAFEAGGPTAALAVMVAIAATIVTAGAGAGLGFGLATAMGEATAAVAATTSTAVVAATITTTGSVIQGMVIGAVSSLASQSAMAAINNRPVLQALTSRDAMKNLFCSMASAGISKGVCHKLGLSLTPDAPKEVPLSMPAVAKGVVTDVAANSISLTQHLSYHAVNSGVGAAVHIAAGDRADNTLRNAAIATVTDTLASFGGAHITESVRGSFGRGVLEVGLNAGTGFIKDGGKGAFGGAIGAGVASLCTSATDLDAEEAQYREQHPNASATEVNEHLAQSQRASHALTQILGAAVAMFAEADVNAASSAARNVTEQHIRAHYLDCMEKHAFQMQQQQVQEQFERELEELTVSAYEDEDEARSASSAAFTPSKVIKAEDKAAIKIVSTAVTNLKLAMYEHARQHGGNLSFVEGDWLEELERTQIALQLVQDDLTVSETVKGYAVVLWKKIQLEALAYMQDPLGNTLAGIGHTTTFACEVFIPGYEGASLLAKSSEGGEDAHKYSAEAMDSMTLDAVMLTCGTPGYVANVTLKAGIKATKGVNKLGKLFKGLQKEVMQHATQRELQKVGSHFLKFDAKATALERLAGKGSLAKIEMSGSSAADALRLRTTILPPIK